MGFRWRNGLDVDPAYDAIQSHPRGQALLQRIDEDLARQRANVERWEAEGSIP